MRRETWMAITAALALAALGGAWFAVKGSALADPGEPTARPSDLAALTRVTPARRFYAPSVDHQLMEIAARRPLFNARRESYGTAASLALAPEPGPGPVLAMTPPPTQTSPSPQIDGLAAPPQDSVAAAVIETTALPPPSAGTAPPATTPAPSAAPAPRPAPAPTPRPQPAATPAPQPAPAPAPIVQPPQPAVPPPSGPYLPPGALALAGVFPRADGRNAALIRLPDNSIIEGGVGATVAGWRIQAMTPFSVTLWNGRDQITIRVPGR